LRDRARRPRKRGPDSRRPRNAYRLNGDAATALTTVDEASQLRPPAMPAFRNALAALSRGDLSRSKADDQRAAAAEERSRAAALMQETGALIFANFINGSDAEAKTPMPKQMPPFAG